MWMPRKVIAVAGSVRFSSFVWMPSSLHKASTPCNVSMQEEERGGPAIIGSE